MIILYAKTNCPNCQGCGDVLTMHNVNGRMVLGEPEECPCAVEGASVWELAKIKAGKPYGVRPAKEMGWSPARIHRKGEEPCSRSSKG